ncbi:MAG: glycosyltransferase, partial [Pirellulales bacterium]|nr:glycosyltransferase [Pirellulales bacterium]
MTLAIISAPGSRGDVNPMVAIGKHLRRLGFEVVISLAESYAEVARAADLQVEPIIDHAGFQNVLSRPHLWKPIRGARTIFREVAADFLPRHDQVIRKHHRPGQTILVSHPLDFASRVFRELDPQTPLFDVH